MKWLVLIAVGAVFIWWIWGGSNTPKCPPDKDEHEDFPGA